MFSKSKKVLRQKQVMMPDERMSDDNNDTSRELVMEVVGEIEDSLEKLKRCKIKLSIAVLFGQISNTLSQIRFEA